MARHYRKLNMGSMADALSRAGFHSIRQAPCWISIRECALTREPPPIGIEPVECFVCEDLIPRDSAIWDDEFGLWECVNCWAKE